MMFVILWWRFNDIAPNVRRVCVQASQEFLVNHPALVKDIAGVLVFILVTGVAVSSKQKMLLLLYWAVQLPGCKYELSWVGNIN